MPATRRDVCAAHVATAPQQAHLAAEAAVVIAATSTKRRPLVPIDMDENVYARIQRRRRWREAAEGKESQRKPPSPPAVVQSVPPRFCFAGWTPGDDAPDRYARFCVETGGGGGGSGGAMLPVQVFIRPALKLRDHEELGAARSQWRRTGGRRPRALTVTLRCWLLLPGSDILAPLALHELAALEKNPYGWICHNTTPELARQWLVPGAVAAASKPGGYS